MAIVVLVASNALAQDRRPPTIDDLLNLVQVSGAEISPDGKHVIYTIGQSMIFYQGLKDRGVPTRFIRFPREPHGFREPHHIRNRDAEEISWLMKYTRGID